MKSRAEAAALVQRQLENNKRGLNVYAHHYGRMELRELLDFIYEGEPKSDAERIAGGMWGE